MNRRVGLADHVDVLLVRQRRSAAWVLMNLGRGSGHQKKAREGSLHIPH